MCPCMYICVHIYCDIIDSVYIRISSFLYVCDQVSGLDPPKPVSSFGHFGFDEKLLGAVRKSEYTQPTPIQAQVKAALILPFCFSASCFTASPSPFFFLLVLNVNLFSFIFSACLSASSGSCLSASSSSCLSLGLHFFVTFFCRSVSFCNGYWAQKLSSLITGF